ncbi:rot1 [Fusarium beomiforme]|uniref:Rot1 n=1 Tax=Fusarium beomiforme TaxID=44412 RepID=A0A9P5E569_9HYPO|nr:rot1 [Fusarium beomiforme]
MYISQLANIIPSLSLTAASIVTNEWAYDMDDEDIESMSVKSLACWDEDKDNIVNYMGWKSSKDIPLVITGYEGVNGPHSPLCFTCWILENEDGRQAVLVLDRAMSGFATDFETFDSFAVNLTRLQSEVNVAAFHSPDLRDCGVGPERAEKDRSTAIDGYEPFGEPG